MVGCIRTRGLLCVLMRVMYWGRGSGLLTVLRKRRTVRLSMISVRRCWGIGAWLAVGASINLAIPSICWTFVA